MFAAGCSGEPPAVDAERPTTPVPLCAAPTTSPRPELDQVVTVFAYCRNELLPLTRVIPKDQAPLRATVTQLLLGVTPPEAAAGFGSSFSSFNAGALLSATIENGVATLDLTSGFENTSNFSTTGGSTGVLAQLKATVFQFAEITTLELEIDGEPWCGWENPCRAGPGSRLRIRR